jgi:O-antigen/teichoic acid export membrane protein
MLYIPVSSATSGLFLPRVTQISVKESAHKELSDLFIRVGRIQFIMLALVLTGFGLYGQQFVNMWAGQEYATSYLVAMVMMVPLTIPLIQNVGISILQAKNMHSFRSIVFLVVAVINVAISVPCIKLWGPVGSAVGTALSLTVGQIAIMNVYYCKYLNLEIGKFWREISKMLPSVLLPCGLAYLFLQWLSADHLSGFMVNVIFYTTVYCLSMYLLGMNHYEKQLILYPVKRLTAKFILSKCKG